MRKSTPLTAAEVAFLTETCKPLAPPSTVEAYVDGWSNCVQELEDGFTLEIESYRGLLLARTSYAQDLAAASMPDTLRSRLEAALPSVDARFRACTWVLGRSLIDPKRDPAAYWWECRLPNQILPDLMQDLRPYFDAQLRTRGYID